MVQHTQPSIIVMTGPESSGKTALGIALAESLNCPFIEEQARNYLSSKNTPYSYSDLIHIGHLQKKSLERAISAESQFIILDTWIYVLMIWSKIRFGKIPETFLKWRNFFSIELFILCAPDFDWEIDPLREHPQSRGALFNFYHNVLSHDAVNFVIAQGTLEIRVQQIKSRLDLLG